MLILYLEDTDGSRCTLTFHTAEQWIRTTWTGHIDAQEAMRGAENYLVQVEPFHCPYLLNDDGGLSGSWFDSVEWLERAWLPHALRLGLRYVAHVVQAHKGQDILSLTFPDPLVGELELQIFHRVEETEQWLRDCQQRPRPASC
jgi:hypothetical protein